MLGARHQDDLEVQRGGPRRYDGPMVRLHNPHLNVQVYVAEHQAARLLANGYLEGPLPDPGSTSTADKR